MLYTCQNPQNVQWQVSIITGLYRSFTALKLPCASPVSEPCIDEQNIRTGDLTKTFARICQCVLEKKKSFKYALTSPRQNHIWEFESPFNWGDWHHANPEHSRSTRAHTVAPRPLPTLKASPGRVQLAYHVCLRGAGREEKRPQDSSWEQRSKGSHQLMSPLPNQTTVQKSPGNKDFFTSRGGFLWGSAFTKGRLTMKPSWWK